jgi:hypothetical protein
MKRHPKAVVEAAIARVVWDDPLSREAVLAAELLAMRNENDRMFSAVLAATEVLSCNIQDRLSNVQALTELHRLFDPGPCVERVRATMTSQGGSIRDAL